ncbi:MAG: hypothetical protein VYE68_08105 [Acidobacteriota bacterium]|nr:hypothetical protein [Acidobacteriota bacterium]
MTPVLAAVSLFVATAIAQFVYGSTLYFACTALETNVSFKHALTNALGILILSGFMTLTTFAVFSTSTWIMLFLPIWMLVTVISYVSDVLGVGFRKSFAVLLMTGAFFTLAVLVFGRLGELVQLQMAAG